MDKFEKALAEAKAKDEAIMMKSTRPRGCDLAKIIQVIETYSLRGRGTDNDPTRQVIQYWNFEGKLLAEFDPINESD